LNDFVACDILPESVFCIDFCPDCKFEDAMVYDRSTNIAVDIYLMSGTITNSRSKYNETHTVSRTPSNLWRDLCSVGKRPIKNIEFFDIAVGSNVKTSINGSKDWTTVGGHLDTANRRMIAANGCEEMCGYLMTVLTPISTLFNTTGYTTDTHASFGTSYGMINTVAAGGYWGYNNSYSGLTSRYTSIYEYTATNYIGTRGCKEMRINQERRY
jgi:hypothetical protein